LVILGKTGTPDKFDRGDYQHFNQTDNIEYDIALYTFSLLTEEQYQRLLNNTSTDNVQNAGITCVIRIVHSFPKNGTHRIGNMWSYNARDFLSQERVKKILFYTDKLFR
jgi:hypothetical protein